MTAIPVPTAPVPTTPITAMPVAAVPDAAVPVVATPTRKSRKPKREPISIDHAVEEGMLIARSALTMEVKNRIIVDAIAAGRPYEATHARELVQRELIELADENEQAAARVGELAAAVLTPRGAYTREGYQAGDHEALANRATIHARMCDELRELSSDDEYLDAVAERAREQAWSEVGDAIQSRLIRSLPVSPDRFYEEEKAARIQALYDINLRALEKRARRSSHHRHQPLDTPQQPSKSGLSRFLRRNRPTH